MDVKHLQGLALFERLSKDQLAEVARQADEIDVEAGKRLVSEGRFGYEFFVIENGTAEVTRGGEHVADLGPGDFFGEMGILSEEGRRLATVVAKTDMKLLTLKEYDVDRMRKKAPEMIDALVQAIKERSEGS